MSETQKHTTRNGFITIIGTYIIWGLLPLYFVLMAPAGPIEIVVARVVFSLIFCAPATTDCAGNRGLPPRPQGSPHHAGTDGGIVPHLRELAYLRDGNNQRSHD